MLLGLVKHLLRTTAFHEVAKISVLSITLQPVQFGYLQIRQRMYLNCTDKPIVFLHSSNH